ncbi:MAG: serpin family protein [Dethiobacteria bacterium]|nr:serpin family protein [Dethiobacteria bacterium]
MFNRKGMLYIALTAMILCFALIGGGCNLFGSEGLAAPVEELDEQLVDANNGFGLKMFYELAGAEPEKNIFISPASIITALAMTYNGADGETREAMEKTLMFEGMSMEEVNEAFADLLTILQNPDPKVELAVANSLWAREGIAFNENFLKRNEDYFGAEVAELDFNDAGAADTINDWVKEKTRNKIDGIIDPPINPETVLFLINAIYFKGEWSDPFDPELTRDLAFNLPDGSQKDLPVMFKYDDFRYLETEEFQALSLPYGKNERVSMYVFLPAANSSLEELYREMNVVNWKKWIASFGSMEGEIGLPRFKFEYEASLNDALNALGMGIAFDGSAADFSGMHPMPPRLVISEVKHKTFVEVNEEGTEAAAVTSIEVGVTAMPETFSMIVDRPFFFAIADDMTGTILFMGSVTNP